MSGELLASHKPVAKLKVTCWTASDPVTKVLQLGEDGNLISASTASNLYEGDVEVIECTAREFAETYLPKLTQRQCTSYGIPRYKSARSLTTKDRLNDDLVAAGYIARDNDNMVWPEGSAIMMVDYDPEEGAGLRPEEFCQAFYDLVPELRGCAHVHWFSSSSYVYNAETGDQLSAAKGQRLYACVSSGADIPRAADALQIRAWLQGYGRIKISKSGRLLVRCALFDVSVYQPNRIDFCADPVCHPPLDSRRPPPTFLGDENLLLDTAAALPDLNQDEVNQYEALVRAAKQSKEEEAVLVKAAWKNEQVEAAVERGWDPDVARRIYSQAADEGVLGPEFELITSEGEVLTVEQILAQPEKFHERRFRDPIEPDYRNDERVAVAFTLGSMPKIYSHAHGGVTYRLQRKLLSAKPSGGDRNEELQKIALHLGENHLAFADEEVPYFLNDQYRLELLDIPKAMRLIDSNVELMKSTKNGKLVRTDSPEQLGKLLIGAHASDLPQIKAVSRQPILDPKTGEVLSKTDYYEVQRLMVMGERSFCEVPQNPTTDQVEIALREFWRPVHQFPWVEAVDQSVTLAAMLTVLVRPLLRTAPAFAFDAPVQGSGKTLLAEAVSRLCGEKADPLPPLNSDKEDEVRKRLLSTLLGKPPVVLIDNIVGEFDSPSFAALLTAGTFSDRILGVSKNATVTPRSTVLLTGNNICFRGDMARRVYLARIDPRVESPHQREFDFSPLEYVEEHHQALVAAGLTLLRAYFASKPEQRIGKGRTASFEVWDDCVRQTVCWLAQLQQMGEIPTDPALPMLCDPNIALNDAVQQDPEVAKLEEVLYKLVCTFGFNAPMTCRDLAIATDVDNPLSQQFKAPFMEAIALRGALADVAGDAKRSEPNPRSLGRWFAKHEDRLIHGVALRQGRKRNGSATWYVEDCEGNGLQGFDDFESDE